MTPNVSMTPNTPNSPNDSKSHYAAASKFLRERWFPQAKGRWFTTQDVWNFGQIRDTEKRIAVGEVLYHLAHELKNPELRQSGKQYRLIDRDVEYINWWEADSKRVVKFKWMYSQEDDTNFGFEENIIVTPGDLIVVAGDTNAGKTAICLNVLAENMDYLPCTYFASEFNATKFKSRMDNFDWVEWLDVEGKPKFELVRRYENYEDVIRPNGLNIIDWMKPPTDIWKIADTFRGIIKELKDGVCVVALQKPKGRDEAFGKEWTMQEASVYLSLSYDDKAKHNVLKVMKVKSPGAVDPNGKRYSFWLRGGTKFCNINEVE
jgi:hypothetical protein